MSTCLVSWVLKPVTLPRKALPYELPPGDHPKFPIYAEVVLALFLGAVLSLFKKQHELIIISWPSTSTGPEP